MNTFDLVTFKAGLLHGLGLPFTCQILGYDPRDVSEYLRSHPTVMRECQEALAASFKAMLAYANKLLSEKKFQQWQTQSRNLKEFVGTLTLWEQHCTTAQAEDPLQITTAFHIYRNPAEVANACGLTLPILVQKILANQALKTYLKNNNLFG